MFSPILIEYFFFIFFSWVILGLRESFSQSTTYRLKTFFRIDHRVQSSRASQNYMAICNHELTKFTYCNQLLDFNEGRPNYCNRQPCSCTYKLNLNFMKPVYRMPHRPATTALPKLRMINTAKLHYPGPKKY